MIVAEKILKTFFVLLGENILFASMLFILSRLTTNLPNCYATDILVSDQLCLIQLVRMHVICIAKS